MGTIALATPPGSTDITTLSRVKEEMGIAETSQDALLSRIISEASDLVYQILGREVYRAQWTEKFIGNSRYETLLSRYPVASIESVSYGGSAQTLSEFAISSHRTGCIHSVNGFATGGSDPNEWVVTYTAGYFLPGDDIVATTISAASADDSYSDSGSGFPTLLRPGDTISVSGFVDAADNGMKTVTTAAAAKIVVGQTLVLEAAGPSVTLKLESIGLTPFSRVVTGIVSSLYLNRKRDGSLKSLKVGDVTFDWGTALREKATRELDPFRDFP